MPYEDMDLGMTIRKHGHQVYFQPAAIVSRISLLSDVSLAIPPLLAYPATIPLLPCRDELSLVVIGAGKFLR